jgi:hypothetical protein
MGINDVLEQFSINDGALRRKLFSGLIVVAITATYWVPPKTMAEIDVSALLTSPVIALLLVLTIYIVGTVVELVGELFLVRAVGASMWAMLIPVREINLSSRVARWLLRGLVYFLVMPFFVYFAGLLGLLGMCPYKEDISRIKNPASLKCFEEFPIAVRVGLTEPFGEYFDLAWHEVAGNLTPKAERFLLRLIGRIRDVLAITTALVVGDIVALTALSATDFAEQGMRQPIILALVLFPLILFYAYMLILRSGIKNCIELATLKAQADEKP